MAYSTLPDEVLTEFDLHDKPSQLFNCDETGFTSKDSSKEKAFGLKGQQLYRDKVCLAIISSIIVFVE